MSNSYSEFSGYLYGAKHTPFLDAVFGEFYGDKSGTTDEAIAIYEDPEDLVCWDRIVSAVLELAAKEFGDGGGTPETAIVLLAQKFGTTNLFPVPVGFLGGESLYEFPTIAELHKLAMILNDGHGLKAIGATFAWYSGRNYVFSQGGGFAFESEKLGVFANSLLLTRYSALSESLVKDDLDAAYSGVKALVEDVFSSIKDRALAKTFRERYIKEYLP